jgi:hypothetical protein
MGKDDGSSLDMVVLLQYSPARYGSSIFRRQESIWWWTLILCAIVFKSSRRICNVEYIDRLCAHLKSAVMVER